MILQYILTEIDGELNRLAQLRTIVAGLKRSSPVIAADMTLPASPVKATELAKPDRRRDRTRITPSQTQPKQIFKRSFDLRALNSAIPSGPVVIPAAMVRQREATKTLPSSAGRSPEELLKELSVRWGTRAGAPAAGVN